MKRSKIRINFEIIAFILIIGILLIINLRTNSQLKILRDQSTGQNGSLILSLVQFNDIVKDYIEGDDYNEKELYGLGKRCISSSIEANNLGLETLSINYRYLGEKLEELSNTYKLGKNEEQSKLIDEIEHFINTNEGIYEIIKDKSESLYNISLEDLHSTELIKTIDEYDYKQQSKSYKNDH